MKIMILAILAVFIGNSFASVENGKAAPSFKLVGHDKVNHELEKYKGKYVVLEWYNDGCPYVRKHYDSKNMQKLQAKWAKKDVVWLAINSSAKGKQGYLADASAAQAMYSKEGAKAKALLIDSDGKVGGAYGAKTTPHMFVIDPTGKVIYQGAIDSVRSYDKDDIAEAKNYVDEAMTLALAKKPVKVAKTEPYGCSVKY